MADVEHADGALADRRDVRGLGHAVLRQLPHRPGGRDAVSAVDAEKSLRRASRVSAPTISHHRAVPAADLGAAARGEGEVPDAV